jgi:hypothetical protein
MLLCLSEQAATMVMCAPREMLFAVIATVPERMPTMIKTAPAMRLTCVLSALSRERHVTITIRALSTTAFKTIAHA